MSDFLDHMQRMPRLDAFDFDHPSALLGYGLVLTGTAFPEQYDVTLDGVVGAAGGGLRPKPTVVGYLRLRHGHFRAEAQEFGGETVYEAWPEGDGIFEENERLHHLTTAILCIDGWRAERGLARPAASPETEAAHRIAAAVARIVYNERTHGATCSAIMAGLELAKRAATRSADTDAHVDDVADSLP